MGGKTGTNRLAAPRFYRGGQWTSVLNDTATPPPSGRRDGFMQRRRNSLTACQRTVMQKETPELEVSPCLFNKWGTSLPEMTFSPRTKTRRRVGITLYLRNLTSYPFLFFFFLCPTALNQTEDFQGNTLSSHRALHCHLSYQVVD